MTDADETSLTVRRTFDAPRERVFGAFTDPAAVERWFAPPGMTAEVGALEPEPGGAFVVTWTAGENVMENAGTFEELVEDERIVTFEETEAGESRLTYEFRDAEGGTEVVLTHELPDAGMVEGASEGWASILDNLAAVVSEP